MNVKQHYLVLVSFSLLALLSACAGSETFLRSQPSTHLPSNKEIVESSDIKSLITVHCVQSRKVEYTDTGTKAEECLYVSADVSGLTGAAISSDVRLKVVDALITISDLNCSTFLHRAFANRAGLDYTKTLLQDLATAGSAGTAFASAPAAAALSGTNLILGKGIDTFNSTYYQQQTFQALAAAIASERQLTLANIDSHEAKIDSYTTAAALADIRAYDDACSFKNGLAKLNEIATKAKADATTVKDKVQATDDPAQKVQLINGEVH